MMERMNEAGAGGNSQRRQGSRPINHVLDFTTRIFDFNELTQEAPISPDSLSGWTATSYMLNSTIEFRLLCISSCVTAQLSSSHVRLHCQLGHDRDTILDFKKTHRSHYGVQNQALEVSCIRFLTRVDNSLGLRESLMILVALHVDKNCFKNLGIHVTSMTLIGRIMPFHVLD